MYYRVAISSDSTSIWRWKSTILSSLDVLFRFLRQYSALPQDQLRVFSSSSREEMNEMLKRENNGLESNSVTAKQFLQDRMMGSRETLKAKEVAAQGREENRRRVSIAVATYPALSESSMGMPLLEESSVKGIDRRRIEIERGAGGDHDIPYRFTLPASLPQTLVWIRLLTKVQDGELEL